MKTYQITIMNGTGDQKNIVKANDIYEARDKGEALAMKLKGSLLCTAIQYPSLKDLN